MRRWYHGLGLGSAVAGLLAGCGTFERLRSPTEPPPEVQSAVPSSPAVAAATQQVEEVSLAADRESLKELRAEIPAETQRRNDELATVLQIMQPSASGGLTPPNEVRQRFEDLVRRKRRDFDQRLKGLRDTYSREEKSARDQFLKVQADERTQWLNRGAATREERRSFSDSQEKRRAAYFSAERDARKAFDSDLMQRRRTFDLDLRDLRTRFDDAARDHRHRFEEAKRAEKMRRDSLQSTTGSRPLRPPGSGATGVNPPRPSSSEDQERFDRRPTGPGVPLGAQPQGP